MAHAQVFKDEQGEWRWVAIWNDKPPETSTHTFASFEEAQRDAMRLPLTIVPLRESDLENLVLDVPEVEVETDGGLGQMLRRARERNAQRDD